MHRDAGSGSEYRVILILTRRRRTAVAAALVTGESMAIVPTARALAQVTPQRSHVAQGLRPHRRAALGKQRKKLREPRMIREV